MRALDRGGLVRALRRLPIAGIRNACLSWGFRSALTADCAALPAYSGLNQGELGERSVTWMLFFGTPSLQLRSPSAPGASQPRFSRSSAQSDPSGAWGDVQSGPLAGGSG